MSLTPPDPEDFGPPEIPEEFRAAADLLIEKHSDLEDVTRKLGLYMENVHCVGMQVGDEMKAALVIEMTIGDLAFSNRVQDPEEDEMDKQFREMQVNMLDDEYLDERQRIARNIAAGRGPLDDGEQGE